MNLEGRTEGRKFGLNMLNKIAAGDIVKIDYVQGAIEKGYISREESVPYIEKGLSKFTREREISRELESCIDRMLKKVDRYEDLYVLLNWDLRIMLPYHGFPDEQYRQARKALKLIKRGKPFCFRGHTI